MLINSRSYPKLNGLYFQNFCFLQCVKQTSCCFLWGMVASKPTVWVNIYSQKSVCELNVLCTYLSRHMHKYTYIFTYRSYIATSSMCVPRINGNYSRLVTKTSTSTTSSLALSSLVPLSSSSSSSWSAAAATIATTTTAILCWRTVKSENCPTLIE